MLSGVTVLELSAVGQDANLTLTQVSKVLGVARQVRQVSWCVMVVVVSDDLAFLAAFAQWSLKGRLLVWSTRLLVVTRLPLHHLQVLHTLLSMTNSMLLVVENDSKSQRCSVYIQLPYSPRGAQALKVASWTPHQDLALTSSLPLFPDKFSRLLHHPTLVVAGEVYPGQTEELVDYPGAPDGKRLVFRGPAASVLDYLAQAINFSLKERLKPLKTLTDYIIPFNKKLFTQCSNEFQNTVLKKGSFRDIIHSDNIYYFVFCVLIKKSLSVSPQEADITLGPFAVSFSRLEVIDFSWPIHIGLSKILGGRGRPVVDPWGFLFPFTPLVWAAILTTLLVMSLTVFLLSSCSSHEIADAHLWFSKAFNYIRVLLQQDLSRSDEWWWEKMVMLVWMMVMLVLSRSYSGNLLALLAVRYIPHPYQTLEDVVHDPSVKMIWKANTIYENYFRTSTSGIYRKVGDLETRARVVRRPHLQILAALDTLVRSGDQVLLDNDASLINLMVEDFLRTDTCDFYKSREGYFAFPYSLVLQKDSPLLPSVNKRVLDLMEAGFYLYWTGESGTSASPCAYPPSRVTVNTALAVSDLWGMFLMLLGGHVVGLLALLLEPVSTRI
nr:glutamate receptor-like [Procambarus clarkii]